MNSSQLNIKKPNCIDRHTSLNRPTHNKPIEKSKTEQKDIKPICTLYKLLSSIKLIIDSFPKEDDDIKNTYPIYVIYYKMYNDMLNYKTIEDFFKDFPKIKDEIDTLISTVNSNKDYAYGGNLQKKIKGCNLLEDLLVKRLSYRYTRRVNKGINQIVEWIKNNDNIVPETDAILLQAGFIATFYL